MIEITKNEFSQFLKDRNFSDWQIKFAIETDVMVTHPRYIEYMKHFGFNMFQIRFLIKIFKV